MNQLDQILEFTGKPSEEDIEAINSPFASTMLEKYQPQDGPRALSDRYPHAPEEALDLLKKLLVFNPNKRISPRKALRHPYLEQFHDSAEEPSCKSALRITLVCHVQTIEDKNSPPPSSFLSSGWRHKGVNRELQESIVRRYWQKTPRSKRGATKEERKKESRGEE